MKLNDIDIANVIEISRKKFDWLKLLSDYVIEFCISMTVGIILNKNLIIFAISTGITLGVINAPKIYNFTKKKKKAIKQLDDLAKYLMKNGIDVNRINLQKSKIGEIKTYNYSSGGIATTCAVENITVFEDNHQKLNALKQIRHDILMTGDVSKKDTVIDGNYTEIIKREEEAKREAAEKVYKDYCKE